MRGFASISLLVTLVLLVAGGFWWFNSEKKGENLVQKAEVPGKENLEKLMQGCPYKDCIPSIDNPKFESVSDADKWLKPEDVVFSISYKGEARGYPERILNWHEIVNDVIAQDPIVITFCPLCGSALAFDRRINDQVLEFGVSGKLNKNDLVMYDRQTNGLWQQITREAIVGQNLGKKLKQISMDGMRWEEFRKQYPHAKVLSRDTGFSRDYDVYPYGTYEQDKSTLFPVDGGVDETIHSKTVVYGIEVDSKFKAYQEEDLKKTGRIKDGVGGDPVELYYHNGDISVGNLKTKEEIVATRLFWFAWKAFHPETELYILKK